MGISFENVLTEKENEMSHININFYDNIIISGQQSDEFNFINFTQEEVLDGALS